MQRGLLLDVVVRERAAVLELLAGEDEALLVGGDALLVLDLGLDVVNRVRRLDLERDGLATARGEEGRERLRVSTRFETKDDLTRMLNKQSRAWYFKEISWVEFAGPSEVRLNPQLHKI